MHIKQLYILFLLFCNSNLSFWYQNYLNWRKLFLFNHKKVSNGWISFIQKESLISKFILTYSHNFAIFFAPDCCDYSFRDFLFIPEQPHKRNIRTSSSRIRLSAEQEIQKWENRYPYLCLNVGFCFINLLAYWIILKSDCDIKHFLSNG